MPSELHAERRDGALVLTISHPSSRNTLSEQVFAAIIESLDHAETDASVHCVVLRGDGAHFCAGGNVRALLRNRDADPSVQGAMLQGFHDVVEALRVFPKPVIACVEGAAAGGGFSLALACDLIVAAEDATFILSYGRIGLSPDGGANAVASAKELVNQWPERSLAQQLDAERAHFLDNLFDANGAEGLQSFLDKRPARFG
jgi:enoyl-CoA hydratase/carnithine racemase